MEICEQYKAAEETNRGVYSVAMASISWPAIAMRVIACKIRQRRSYRARRRAFRGLLHLDDKMLWDIGVTREELLSADALPLSISAAEELNRVSLMRRRKEKMGGLPR